MTMLSEKPKTSVSATVRAIAAKTPRIRKAGAGTTPRAPRIPAALRAQAELLVEKPYPFIDSPLFKKRTTERELFETAEPPLPQTRWYQPTRDDTLGDNAGTPQLMKPAEEQLMFRRYNFCKYNLGKLQKTAKADGLTKELAEQLVEWDRRHEHYREYITRTNLALVLAMAKRSRLGDIDFAEVVSEGNMALLRSVEKFNVDRGFKFSTYACRSILKAFSRTAQKHTRHRSRFPVEFEPDLEKSDWSDVRRDTVEKDCVDELKQIVDRNLADLTTVEQTVIKRRFNWEERDATPLTLEEVGRIIGVTKERVRQIQNKALIKIRSVMEDGVLRVQPEQPEPDAPVATMAPAEGQQTASEVPQMMIAAGNKPGL
jgi:RNA polymerase primary sigma factor